MNKSLFCKDKFLRSIFALALLAAMIGTPVCSSAQEIIILHPPNNYVVNRWVQVSGRAYLPPGYHLWILVSYRRNRDLWWPIAEARINPQSRAWSIPVTLGRPEEFGQFHIAVGPVDNSEHQRLENYLRGTTGKGDSGHGPQPIRMPRFLNPPEYRMVIRR